MTDTELSAFRARAEAATPGPWAFDNYPLGEGLSILGSGGHIVIDDGSAGGEYGSSTTIENMRFIRDARKDIPALLEHIDEQKAALSKAEADKAALVEALGWHCDNCREKCEHANQNGIRTECDCKNCPSHAALARVKGEA